MSENTNQETETLPEETIQFFRKMRDFTEEVQAEISACLVKDEEFNQRFDEARNKSEEWMMKQIDTGIRVFVGIMPLALINGVNPIMSVLASHGSVTGNDSMTKIVEQLNKDNGLPEWQDLK